MHNVSYNYLVCFKKCYLVNISKRMLNQKWQRVNFSLCNLNSDRVQKLFKMKPSDALASLEI